MIADDFRIKGEFYNAPVYNWMIKKGQKVTIHEISKDKTHLLGTPEELERYINDYAKTIR
jgi:UDP-N-acetylglucosamine diphosphorylase / glucose-1-phosphate thymidylyltransferase / UDP-N-acetylgalactosamine diphosphorylase / glucosamine-1-phosphate N-acetyltransferase / galactosamine-1-phosphate N-acetyltransferase